MTVNDIINGLEKNLGVFEALFDLPHEDLILFKPKTDSWCFLEIACHLIDEEVEDFRTRVAHALNTLEKPFKPIRPATWPQERKYLEQDYYRKIAQFDKERKESLRWLRSLENVDWNKEFLHPDLDKISANRFLHNWLAHDYLHIRQLNALKYSFLQSSSNEDLSYAGNW